jgi:hypothetical protein
MSISITYDSDTSNLERTRALIARSVNVVEETLEPRAAPRLTRLAQNTIGRDPGPVQYRGPGGTLRWESDKQRRFVMRLYRMQGITKYTRTGKYRKGYRVFVVNSPDGFLVVLRNRVPYAAFVGGRWQQRFHKDTGWELASEHTDELNRVANEIISDILDEFWSRR